MKTHPFTTQKSWELSITFFCDEEDDTETPTDDEGCPTFPDYADSPE